MPVSTPPSTMRGVPPPPGNENASILPPGIGCDSTVTGACCQRAPLIVRRYHRSMADITRADVQHVADLAQLHLTDEELDRMQAQLSRILEAIETLRDVDTSQVGPTASVIKLENVMRDDVARPGITRDAALANAPLRDDPFLRVPTVLEEGR